LKASKHEVGHGRDITWTLRTMPAPDSVVGNWPGSAKVIEVRSQGHRDGKTVDETRHYAPSLGTSANALLRHVRDPWSIEYSWHWPRDTQLMEDAQRYREGNGVRILASLRSMAMDALRPEGFWSITEGLAALSHDIRELLTLLGWKRQGHKPSGCLLIGSAPTAASPSSAATCLLPSQFQLHH
jgi:predicted transposase YbfD/YdcC